MSQVVTKTVVRMRDKRSTGEEKQKRAKASEIYTGVRKMRVPVIKRKSRRIKK